MTLTERALDKVLIIFREAGVMPPTDEDGWARIDGRWMRLKKAWRAASDGGYDIVYRVVEPSNTSRANEPLR